MGNREHSKNDRFPTELLRQLEKKNRHEKQVCFQHSFKQQNK